MTYKVFYWGKAQSFLGRSFAPQLILAHAGIPFTMHDPSEKPGATFTVPAVVTPSGIAVSQVPAIMHALGHDPAINLAPTDPAADAKALQICCDSVDLVKEADTEGKVEGDRKAKWLALFDAHLSDPDRALSYADFAALQGLGLCALFRSTTLCVDDFPPGLSAWWAKMKETKGFTAVMAKKVDLMGGRPFP